MLIPYVARTQFQTESFTRKDTYIVPSFYYESRQARDGRQDSARNYERILYDHQFNDADRDRPLLCYIRLIARTYTA